MNRIPLALSLLALAVALAPRLMDTAYADANREAMCYPKNDVLLAAGTDAVNFAAGTTVFMNRMIREGRKNFMVLDNRGTEIVCAW